MKVKLILTPSLHKQFDLGYKSLPNDRIEILGCAEVLDEPVNVQIIATVKEIEGNTNGGLLSFDKELKSYPQSIATILQSLILDLYQRGEMESSWFDFSFIMETKKADYVTEYQDATQFDFVSYYNSLQSEKSSMLLNNGGFAAMMSLQAV